MKHVALAALVLLVGGCSMAPFYAQIKAAGDQAIETAIEDRQDYNDKKVKTLTTLPCDISIGAYYRMDNTTNQKALTMLCSGREPDEPVPSLVPEESLATP
jgi:hypothetical protein